jgi:yeast amino acid transporter
LTCDLLAYSILNVVAVGVFGEAEFWLSGGKVVLIFLLFGFTFVTMVGGNPAGDAYGFRYWHTPGAFAEFASSGNLGRFEGFMGALATAAFVIVGPDYISMVAAEAKHPSRYIKTAFKTVYIRFGIFFIGGALATGIVLPYNDSKLIAIHIDGEGNTKTAAASPYVMAMQNMGIQGLPHAVNALLFTTIYSAGNTYTYCATRSLYSLALKGHAPAFLRKCTAQGVPIYCFAIVMLFPFLSFLQVDSGSAEALNILLSLITGGGVVDYIVMSITFLFYYRACQSQGVDRKTRPYYGYFQPYGACIALIVQVIVVYTYGYTAFTPWDVQNFFANYTMQLLFPILYVAWKLIKKTKIKKPEECNLVWDRPILDAYEARALVEDPPTGFWTELAQMVGLCRGKKPSKNGDA